MTSPSPNLTGGPWPAATETPSQLRRSLEKLPSELLQHIAEGLVPARPLTTRFALRPSGTWEFRTAAGQWSDWLAAQNGLLSFAQASRRMAAIARPLLYHTVVIGTPGALVRLLLRIREREEIELWIRSITCLVNVASSATMDEVDRECQRQAAVKLRTVDFTSNPLEILQDILLRARNLQDFLLASPDREPDHEPPDLMDQEFQDAIFAANSRETITSLLNSAFRLYPFWTKRSLTSLRIYCHRERLNREQTLSILLADFVVEQLPQLTHLKTLELCGASAVPLSTHNEFPFPPLPHIEHLRLFGSQIHEPRLVELCLACVNLQTLMVHFEESSTDADRDLLPEGKTLNDALVGLAGSLRTLELISLSEGHYLTRGRERPRKPENHRLRCIPELTRLETLTLDYRGVFGTLGILEEDDGERLCQLLPPSVRDFTLVCEWGTARDWKQSYLANLDMVLHGVECLCASKAHRLSSISLAIHSWPAEDKEHRFHKRFIREVEKARLRCATAGIKFTTCDLYPSYQDEDEMALEAALGEEDDADDYDIDDEVDMTDLDEEEEQEGAGMEEIGRMPAADVVELEEEDEASEYYVTDEEESDPERAARRPPTFNAFLQRLGEDHGYDLDELLYAYHEDRWDEYLFD
ncbi:uncharacterized protein B0T15DRAFT_285386 [Chaetomium strumarium]|uniref:F-box domain-containing protein n=1 Tax=Chaetomium strumarium TaxID=1170767 RepID=A0AAJ0GPQ2_9PEZI|nr:hypothetical protein B0T15DRAFT_285386 [Chaetomium strumarium]